jgi:hypothetical protein
MYENIPKLQGMLPERLTTIQELVGVYREMEREMDADKVRLSSAQHDGPCDQCCVFLAERQGTSCSIRSSKENG